MSPIRSRGSRGGSTRTGYIYFIASESQQAVKVGFAEDVYTRHKTLQTGNPEELEIRARVRATLAAEQALHALLKSHRIRLEWYPDDDLIWEIMVELQDEVLDRGIEWLAENDPEASDPEDISYGMDECPITASEMTEIVEAKMREHADYALTHP